MPNVYNPSVSCADSSPFRGAKPACRGGGFLTVLYACYNKETHQYGLYDAVHKKFYGDFIETLDKVWVNNPNYYWERINKASGSTVQAREKTFLNICGPDIKTT